MISAKKILITGSNGLLGQKLVYLLLGQQHPQIFACARGENRLIRKEGYTYYSLNIEKAEEVDKVFSQIRPDVIINTAAMTNVDACETQKEECDRANVEAVKWMISALEKLQREYSGYHPHFIHLSTDFVFNGEAGPYREEDVPDPLSYYALSKFRAEEIIKRSNLKWAIARTIIIYGVVDNLSRSNVVLWVKSELEKGRSINVVDDQFRAPTLAEDLAEGCLLIAEKGAEGIYHLSGPETLSILELAYKVADFWKLDRALIHSVKTASLKQPARRPPRTGFILDKARKMLGYNPRTVTEGLRILEKQLSKS